VDEQRRIGRVIWDVLVERSVKSNLAHSQAAQLQAYVDPPVAAAPMPTAAE